MSLAASGRRPILAKRSAVVPSTCCTRTDEPAAGLSGGV